jgi:hypothetical protein
MDSVIFDIKLFEQKVEEIRVLASLNENHAPFLNKYPTHIFQPLQEYLNESLIKGIISKGADYAKTFMKGAKEIALKLSDAIKDFSFKKVFITVSKMMQKLKVKMLKQLMLYLSPLREAIIKFEFCNEENKFDLRVTFKKLIAIAKEAGKDIGAPELLTPIVVDAIRKNADLEGTKALRESEETEAEKGAATFDEKDVEYMEFFQKMMYKLGIKDTKLNGFLSEIVKKIAAGGAMIGIFAVISSLFPTAGVLAGIAAGVGAAVAAAPVLVMIIGAIIFGIGLFMFATWLLKPYPTIENCRIFLSTIFNGSNPFDFPDMTLDTLGKNVEPEDEAEPEKVVWNFELLDQFDEEGIEKEEEKEFGVEDADKHDDETLKVIKDYDDLDLDMVEDDEKIDENKRSVRIFVRKIFKKKGREDIQDMFEDLNDDDEDNEYTDELEKLFSIIDRIYSGGGLEEFPFALEKDSVQNYLKDRNNSIRQRLTKIIDVTDNYIDRVDKSKSK